MKPWYVTQKTYNPHDINFRLNVATNKKDGIRRCRMMAAMHKTSITLLKVTDKETHYVGIAEFPNYLRDHNLTWKEIHFESTEDPF